MAGSNKKRRIRDQIDPTDYTPCFSYRARAPGSREKSLLCEAVAVQTIADAAGTPAYVYSGGAVEAAYRRLDRAFGSLPHAICYAVKANSNLALLQLLAKLGSSFDIVSGGELDRLAQNWRRGQPDCFLGRRKNPRGNTGSAWLYPGRNAWVAKRHFLFSVESEAELEVLLEEAARHFQAGGLPPAAAIRINPDVAAGGHKHISTGKHHHKFGVDWETARRLYLEHKDSRSIVWRGISAHLGSQILTTAPYRAALERLASHVRELAVNGVRLENIDIGGGLGIQYTVEQPLDLAEYAQTLSGFARPAELQIADRTGAVAGRASRRVAHEGDLCKEESRKDICDRGCSHE